MALLSLQHPHWEGLTAETRNAMKLLSRLDMTRRFYLAGGTGLALHLGHRFSVHLDFFSERSDSVGPDERLLLRQALKDPTVTVALDKDGTFVANWHAVGVSFFRLDTYPLVTPPLEVEGTRLATLEEIGAMKLAAVIDRGTRKDLVDLYYILQQVPLDDLFKVASVKYARVRTFALSAMRGLAYFEDAESLPMPRMIDKTSWTRMKKFLEKKALEAGRSRLGEYWA